MAKFVCKMKCSYGDKGDLIELKADSLTERQEIMLKPYKEPVVKEVKQASKTTATKK